jgi:hypothetical protein
MPKSNPQGLEAHLVFCPNNDAYPQINAGQYIAELMPRAVLLGTIRNTEVPDTETFQQQGFYDTVTGYDNPNSLGKRIAKQQDQGLGTKIYGSVFEMLADTKDKDSATASILDAVDDMGVDIKDLYPYYHLVMQLKDTRIPVQNADFLQDENVFYAQEGPIESAARKATEAEAELFQVENGVENFITASLEYRATSRQVNDTVRKNITRIIKRLPSRSNDNDKLVIVIDNPALYDLRKSQYSKRVKTITRSFGSLATAEAAGRKRVLSWEDYDVSVVLDGGLHLSLEKDRELGLEQFSTGTSLLGAMLRHLGCSDETAQKLSEMLPYVDFREKRVAFMTAMKAAAEALNYDTRHQDPEVQDDEEWSALKATAHLSNIVHAIMDVVDPDRNRPGPHSS